jgi:hypothetical protein
VPFGAGVLIAANSPQLKVSAGKVMGAHAKCRATGTRADVHMALGFSDQLPEAQVDPDADDQAKNNSCQGSVEKSVKSDRTSDHCWGF